MKKNEKTPDDSLCLVFSFYGAPEDDTSDLDLLILCKRKDVASNVKKHLDTLDRDEVQEDLNFGWIPVSKIQYVKYSFETKVEIE